MIKRDEHGKFVSIDHDDEETTFVRITNGDIYKAVQGIDERVARIETRLQGSARVWALVLPTVTCLAGVVSALYYVRH